MQLSLLVGDDVTQIHVSPPTLGGLRSAVAAVTGVPPGSQVLTVAGMIEPLAGAAESQLSTYGLTAGDLLALTQLDGAGGGSTTAHGAGARPGGGSGVGNGGVHGAGDTLNSVVGRRGLLAGKRRAPRAPPQSTWSTLSIHDLVDFFALPPDVLHGIFRASARARADVAHDAELRAAIEAPTPDALRALLQQRLLLAGLPGARAAALEARLRANPMDVDAQRGLEEAIARANVVANRETAMEHMPEAFGRVAMLYIPCKINGVSVKVGF